MNDPKDASWKMARAEVLTRWALWCAIVPLAIAILLCIGWAVFRNFLFAISGIFLLYGGAPTCVIGLLIFWRGGWLARQAGVEGCTVPEGFARKRTTALFFLIGDFPAAVCCVVFASLFGPLLIIRNESGKELKDVQLLDSYSSVPPRLIRDFQPGETRRLEVQAYNGDTPPTLNATMDGVPIEGQVYLDRLTGRITAIIHPDGKIDVSW